MSDTEKLDDRIRKLEIDTPGAIAALDRKVHEEITNIRLNQQKLEGRCDIVERETKAVRETAHNEAVSNASETADVDARLSKADEALAARITKIFDEALVPLESQVYELRQDVALLKRADEGQERAAAAAHTVAIGAATVAAETKGSVKAWWEVWGGWIKLLFAVGAGAIATYLFHK